MTSDEYVEGNRKALAICVGVVVLFLVLPFILIVAVEFAIGYDSALAAIDLSVGYRQEILRTKLILAGLSLIYASLGVLFLVYGVAVIKARAFPPPRIPMPFRMKKVVGAKAMIVGIATSVGGLSFVGKSFVGTSKNPNFRHSRAGGNPEVTDLSIIFKGWIPACAGMTNY